MARKSRGKSESTPKPPIHDVAFATSANTNYLYKSDHRDGGNGKKSQWAISESVELATFEAAHTANWLNEIEGWGLHIVATSPAILGHSVEGNPLRLAKFVNNSKPQYWHGYPADYRTKPQDRPSANLLLAWMGLKYISKHEIAKIRNQKKCSLSA